MKLDRDGHVMHPETKDIRRLVCDGFNANEIAWIARLQVEVAEALMREAVPALKQGRSG